MFGSVDLYQDLDAELVNGEMVDPGYGEIALKLTQKLFLDGFDGFRRKWIGVSFTVGLLYVFLRSL